MTHVQKVGKLTDNCTCLGLDQLTFGKTGFSYQFLYLIILNRLFYISGIMDIVLWLVALLLLYIIVQIIRFIYADADLTLLWYCKFGRSKGEQLHTIKTCREIH